jgi:hypothetical protein
MIRSELGGTPVRRVRLNSRIRDHRVSSTFQNRLRDQRCGTRPRRVASRQQQRQQSDEADWSRVQQYE